MKKMRKSRTPKKLQAYEAVVEAPPKIEDDKLHDSLAQNKARLKELLHQSTDIIFREVEVRGGIQLLVVYVDGLVDTKTLDRVFLEPWMYGEDNEIEHEAHHDRHHDGRPSWTMHQLMERQLVPIAHTTLVTTYSEVLTGVLGANVAILANHQEQAIVAELRSFAKRNVEEPAAEPVIRGPREGFAEDIRVNTTLIRRRIRSPQLVIEDMTIGTYTNTYVAIAYIHGLATDELVQEVRRRMESIDLQGVLESGYIEECIEDTPWSPFPQIQNTERPDIVAGGLLEGKVAIIVDGTPFVLIVPMTFWTALQSAEDYYERFIPATFMRLVRMLLLNIALLFPGVYVAITVFHPQMIPTSLAISIASSQEKSPFPAVVEAFVMMFMFEGLREAGIRLPKPVGSAVSIVGGLVLGQAAVQAGIVSAPMIIVVSVTGIASFAIPRYNFGLAYRMLVFPTIFFAGLLGLYGIWIMTFIIFIHVLSLSSFGVPYMSPWAPKAHTRMRDVVFRQPRWAAKGSVTLFQQADTKASPPRKTSRFRRRRRS